MTSHLVIFLVPRATAMGFGAACAQPWWPENLEMMPRPCCNGVHAACCTEQAKVRGAFRELTRWRCFICGRDRSMPATGPPQPRASCNCVCWLQGDEYVDWVGCSIYHFGTSFPYGANVDPLPRTFTSTVCKPHLSEK